MHHPALSRLRTFSHAQWIALCASLGAKVRLPINLFAWENRQGKALWFVGFAFRGQDYERDKQNGTNIVESWIDKGVYDG